MGYLHFLCELYPPIVSVPGQAINSVNHGSIPTDFAPHTTLAASQNVKIIFLSHHPDAIDDITIAV